MSEPVRLTETGSQHQAAGQPPAGHAHPAGQAGLTSPRSLRQESSESTNTTIEDEDTKGRGASPSAPGPPGLLGPLHWQPRRQACSLLPWTEPRFGSFQTEHTVSPRRVLSPLVVPGWVFLIAGGMYLL